MALTEKEYNELSKYAFNVANKYLQNHDDALDMVQNALLALISSKTEITNPKAWIHTTVKHEISQHSKAEQKESEIVKQKKVNIEPPAQSDADSDAVFEADHYRLFRLLKKEDFDEFKLFKKHKFNLTTFSTKEKVSYDVAHQRKYKLKRNLIAALSIADGWEHSSQILNYMQYTAVIRFVKQLKSYLQKENGADLKIYITSKLKAEFERTFENVMDCIEWNITFVKPRYEMFLVCMMYSNQPYFVSLELEFNAKNYLRVTGIIHQKISLVTEPKMAEVQKYKKKGKIDLTNEQIYAIVTNTQTTK